MELPLNPKITAKAWMPLIGTIITVILYALNQTLPFLHGNALLNVSVVIGVLGSIAAYFVPAQLTQSQVNRAVEKGHVILPNSMNVPYENPKPAMPPYSEPEPLGGGLP